MNSMLKYATEVRARIHHDLRAIPTGRSFSEAPIIGFNSSSPVKAHPQDESGQDLIREWMRYMRESRLPVISFSDYDMALTQDLTGGVDAWLNAPRRPWEASGTSGMKVLVNCGLNLSALDGFWAEAFEPDVGGLLAMTRSTNLPSMPRMRTRCSTVSRSKSFRNSMIAETLEFHAVGLRASAQA